MNTWGLCRIGKTGLKYFRETAVLTILVIGFEGFVCESTLRMENNLVSFEVVRISFNMLF